MSRLNQGRRALLRGAGGTALSLPFLEIAMEGKARAAAVPRYVIMYCGASLCREGGDRETCWKPKAYGANYDIPRDLVPLGKVDFSNGFTRFTGYDVRDEVSIVSGLRIPYAEQGQPAPRAGKAAGFHGLTMGPLLTGTQADGGDAFGGPSSDFIVSNSPAIASGTKFPLLAYGVQADAYIGSGTRAGMLSHGSGGRDLPPQVSPKAIFASLAPLIAGSSGQTMDAQGQLRLERDRSILDYLTGRVKRLEGRLGKADRDRVREHFAQIRALEVRLKSAPALAGPSCQKPTMDVVDPVVTRPGKGTDFCSPTASGYSDEITRAVLVREYIRLALTCNLTRVVSLMITWRQSYMSTERINGRNYNLHSNGHGPADDTEFRDMLAWHVEQFAWLARALKNTMDSDGSNMLDNTVILMVTEGGAGYDPEGGKKGLITTHSTENMGVLVAGGRNLGLRPGRHIAGNNAHPASVLLRAMNAVGVGGPLGQVTESFADL